MEDHDKLKNYSWMKHTPTFPQNFPKQFSPKVIRCGRAQWEGEESGVRSQRPRRVNKVSKA